MYFRMQNRQPNSPSSVTKPTQIDPQVDKKTFQNRSRERSGATGWPQVRPKSARKPPKSAPEAPRERPKAPQGRLGGPRRAPKRAKRRPKTAKMVAKSPRSRI